MPDVKIAPRRSPPSSYRSMCSVPSLFPSAPICSRSGGCLPFRLSPSIPLQVSDLQFSRSPMTHFEAEGTGSLSMFLPLLSARYISALEALSHFLGLTLSRHGALRSQNWLPHLSPLSVLFSLSPDGDCSVAVSGALSDCLHASTIPC